MKPSALRQKIHACWVGKAIGGTLGAPHEGMAGPLDLDFYRPVPTAVLPNDDLDLQVVWLHHLRSCGYREVTPEILSDAWHRHVLFPFDEYAVARRNRDLGLVGAAQGSADNFFGECMGAAIRSEVWACVAPDDPARAAGFAWADAVVDHAGEGVWAAVFHAALQSAAFTESDPHKLIDIALGFIPAECRLRRALLDTTNWWSSNPDWRSVRDKIVDRYATGNFTDVVCNLCFELVGWFDGGGDFGRSICTAVNCGLDTDCTGATLGALFGIIAPDSIPEMWRAPIGEDVVLSAGIVDMPHPRDLSELTDWTIEVAGMLEDYTPAIGSVAGHSPESSDKTIHAVRAQLSHETDASVLDAASLPALTNPAAHTLTGTWSKWAPEDFQSNIILLRTLFTAKPDADAELMVFYSPRATAWVNGQKVLGVSATQLDKDPFIAPSFHRAGPAVVPIALEGSGPHELVIALQRPANGQVADLVFGLADHKTHLWLPVVFSDRELSGATRL